MDPKFALLGLLLQGERYGYELKKRIDDEFAPFWQIDFGQLYRSLGRLARDKYVEVHARPGQGGPERRVYRLTRRGRAEFRRWLASPTDDPDEIVVKAGLALGAGLSIPSWIEEQRQVWSDERDRRAGECRTAREAGDPRRLIIAEAALRQARASCDVLSLCEAVLPPSSAPAFTLEAEAPLLITGSDDPLLAQIAQVAHASTLAVGSLDGLLALSRHETDIAGAHLLDVESGEYNVPFVRHLLPEQDLVLVNLAFRENGLMLARGNPLGIRRLHDLTRPGIRFVNRARGTGTRLLLLTRLRRAHIDPHDLDAWERAVATHEAVAAAIAAGTADVGPGLRAVAAEWGLDFIPLGEERYDLVLPRAILDTPRLRPLLETLHGGPLKREAGSLAGYDLSMSGKVVARVR